MARRSAYLGGGGQAIAAATDPFSFTDYSSAAAGGGRLLPFSGLRKKHGAESTDHSEWAMGPFSLFMNSSFSLETELTFCDLTNYKLILQGNFLRCAL